MSERRDGWRNGALVTLAALLPRLYVAIAWAREPVWDGVYYDIGARSIAAGRGYAGVSGAPWCHYPVGYSAILGAAYRLFGPGPLAGPLLNAVLGSATALLCYVLARRALGERRALVAGLLVALLPGLIVYTPLLMTEPSAALLLVAAAAAAAAWPERARGIVLGGLLIGVGTLVRPQTILCAPALALVHLPAGASSLGRLRSAAVATLVALAVVAPWTVRNCLTMDGCAFVSTNGGWNLAIGALPRASGRFDTLHGSDGCPVVTGQVQQDRCWAAVGWRAIAAEPARWLGRIPAKLGFTFDHESFAVGYLGEADPDRWPAPRKEARRAHLTALHRALLAVVPLAFVARPSRRRPTTLLGTTAVVLLAWIGLTSAEHPFWPLALAACLLALLRPGGPPAAAGVLGFSAWALGTLVVTHAVFFGEDRYHLVLTPLLCVLAAAAWRTAPAAASEPAPPFAAAAGASPT